MPVKQILASGGGFVDSGALTQLAADVIGFPITQSGEAEGSARGAAILALESIGTIKNIDMAPVPLGKTYKPHPKDNAIYKNARQRQQRLYDMVAKGIWEENL
ncbi:MAG TPA: FGGY-family carbohydrate kinase, partial [bacterium]|nr:FGGY-family carbohydrate kinase [bacterium]